MRPETIQRIGTLLRPLIPLCILAGALGLGALFLTSCEGDKKLQPAPEEPLSLEHVSRVRVRLGPRPVKTARVGTTGGYRLLVDRRARPTGSSRLPVSRVARRAGRWRIGQAAYRGDELVIEPGPGSFALVGQRKYRGSLHLLPAGGERFHVINHVDLESYVAGVLPEELYPSWHIETYRALAIAARTFALHHKLTSGRGRPFDLEDGPSSQVYGGLLAETDKSWRAVRSTHGVVLGYGPEGEERIFRPHYSSCCGGTVNDADVLRRAAEIPPLQGGQACEHCDWSPRYRWDPVSISKAHVLRALKEVYPDFEAFQRLRSIRVARKTSYGRAVWLDVLGEDGRVQRLRAEDLRIALIRSGLPAAGKLYSMNCRIVDDGGRITFADGRGWGHGVGLCQYGAEGKARQGWTAEEILDFYYPGSTRVTTY